MGLSFRIAPGVRVRASSRGLSAGLGPRVARVHVGTRGVGVSSGVGPVSGYTHLSGSGPRAQRQRSGYGPTKAQVAAHQRELKAAQRQADIEKVQALEAALTNVHHQVFPEASRVEVAAPEQVDPSPIRSRLEAELEIPAQAAALGGGTAPPVAVAAEPVDRYELMREHRKQERQGIPIHRIREQIAAAKRADQAADLAAEAEEARRAAAVGEEQLRLDTLWSRLEAARAEVEERLPIEVGAERARRDKQRDEEQAEADTDWAKLVANEPQTTITVLEQAFADNSSPAAPINCEGTTTTVVMQFAQPEELVPERKPARTPTGKPTLKKRTKTEINELYVKSLASNVLATVKEAFASAPGTKVVRILVVRREGSGKLAEELAAIYAGEFDRDGFRSGGNADLRTLTSAPDADLTLKGKTQAVAPIDLDAHPHLQDLLGELADGLSR